ncbi:MAG: cytochrome c [Gammaproteobacteria bacterium]|nr:cytochrome c [Gammaproteobacteria bacterium]MYD75206.1 cytochrome c [Gammaproteobacteria bacterium]MYJ51797.1 cytochrome c [Gammaproteobacteria bacterium]
MKKTLLLMLMSTALAMTNVTAHEAHAAEKDPVKKAIKARQAAMVLRSWYAGPLFGMAKGDIEYDSEWASALAGSLKAELAMTGRGMWPEESDYENYPDESRSLPELWLDPEGAQEAGMAYADAVNEMANAAGEGLGALRSAVGQLGQSCKGCHESYRAE